MEDRDEPTWRRLAERIRAFLVRDGSRRNRHLPQFQWTNPIRPAPPEAETQGNESHRGVSQALDRSETRRHGSAAVSAATSAENVGPTNQEQCHICLGYFPLSSLERMPCGHSLCDICSKEFMENSLAHDNLFPPSCCNRPIMFSERVFRNLPGDLAHRFLEKCMDVDAEELGQKRPYCHVPQCSTWIRRRNITGYKAVCPKCEELTCTACKEKYHDNGVCTAEGELQVPELDELAAREGWKRCPSCRQMIQRTEGCPEMECICGVRFCYLCERLLRDCNCVVDPQGNYIRPEQHRHRLVRESRLGLSCSRCGGQNTAELFCMGCGFSVCWPCVDDIAREERL